MSKSKVVLKAKVNEDKEDFNISVRESGEESVCITMVLQYLADKIVENDASIKEVTKLLKDIVKDTKDRRGEGTWL